MTKANPIFVAIEDHLDKAEHEAETRNEMLFHIRQAHQLIIGVMRKQGGEE